MKYTRQKRDWSIVRICNSLIFVNFKNHVKFNTKNARQILH